MLRLPELADSTKEEEWDLLTKRSIVHGKCQNMPFDGLYQMKIHPFGSACSVYIPFFLLTPQCLGLSVLALTLIGYRTGNRVELSCSPLEQGRNKLQSGRHS